MQKRYVNDNRVFPSDLEDYPYGNYSERNSITEWANQRVDDYLDEEDHKTDKKESKKFLRLLWGRKFKNRI